MHCTPRRENTGLRGGRTRRSAGAVKRGRPDPIPIATVLLCLLLALVSTQALGHARLVGSEPGEGGTVTAKADAIFLEFSEAIQPRFSDFVFHFLGDDREAAMAEETRLSRQAPERTEAHRHVELPLPADAAPGWYALEWEVLSIDGHTTSGSLRFKLGD